MGRTKEKREEKEEDKSKKRLALKLRINGRPKFPEPLLEGRRVKLTPEEQKMLDEKFIAAVKDEKIDEAILFLKLGADVDARGVRSDGLQGDTSLIRAASWWGSPGHIKMLKCLLSHWANPLLADVVGMTPYEIADWRIKNKAILKPYLELWKRFGRREKVKAFVKGLYSAVGKCSPEKVSTIFAGL